MHGNAATVAIPLILAVFAVGGEAVTVRRDPVAKAAPVVQLPPPVAPPVVQLPPVIPVAKAVAEPEQVVVRRALAVAGKTYEALHTQMAEKIHARIQGLGSGTRAEQAKQLVDQLHPTNQKAAPAKQLRAAGPAWPNMPRRGELDAELQEAEAQAKNKMKELSVQTTLEKEKEEAAVQVQKRAVELRDRATKLRKEADVASQIAKETSDAAEKAEIGLKQAQSQAQKILEEERVMQRFLNQTNKEELVLERNISNLKLEESKIAPVATMEVKSTPVHTVAAGTNVSSKVEPEAMKKLVEENNRLKHEKAVLEQQLSDRKVAKEKAKLKQKLKNRLALADRHMKLQKRMLRTQRH